MLIYHTSLLHLIHQQSQVWEWYNMEATQYPSTDDWINNMGNTHEMEYDSALKIRTFWHLLDMTEPWGHYAKWNKLVTKYRCGALQVVWANQGSQNHRDRKQNGGPQGLGEEGKGALFNERRVSLLQEFQGWVAVTVTKIRVYLI